MLNLGGARRGSQFEREYDSDAPQLTWIELSDQPSMRVPSFFTPVKVCPELEPDR